MSIRQEFDEQVNAADAAIRNQIREIEKTFGTKEDADYYRDLLEGGKGSPADRRVASLVLKTYELLGEDLDIRSFLTEPQEINIALDADARPIQGNFTLSEFWEALFQTTNFYKDETLNTALDSIENLEDWFTTIEESEDETYAAQVGEAQTEIEELESLREGLNSDDDAKQAEALQTYDPEAFAEVIRKPEGATVVDSTPEDAALREVLETVEPTVSKEQPVYQDSLEARAGVGRYADPAETEEQPESAVELTPETPLGPAGGAQGPPDVIAQIQNGWSSEALEAVHELGWGYAFLDYRFAQGDLLIGLNNGVPVPFDTPGAEQVFLVDYIEQSGIVDQADIDQLFAMTEYHETASLHTQEWEEAWYAAGQAEKEAILKPAIEMIEGMLDYFGQDFSPAFARELAFEAARLNLLEDEEFMINAVTTHAEFDMMRSETSASVQAAEDLRQMSREYFTDIPESQAREWVIKINKGDLTQEEVEQMIREQAMARFPELAGFIGDGQTVKGYFATHQATMEDMLGRPVDIYREFPQLYQNGVMTQDDAARMVRSGSEWRHSPKGQDAARLMAYQLGQVFGEVA